MPGYRDRFGGEKRGGSPPLYPWLAKTARTLRRATGRGKRVQD